MRERPFQPEQTVQDGWFFFISQLLNNSKATFQLRMNLIISEFYTKKSVKRVTLCIPRIRSTSKTQCNRTDIKFYSADGRFIMTDFGEIGR